MKKITALKVQTRNPNRVNVYLDGEFAFGVARITAAWLNVGDALDEAKIERLKADDARERAFQQAALFLSYRARSEAEIRKNLRKRETPEAIVEETILRLRRDGLTDDEQFARTWVENRTTFRPRSRYALALELRQKGLAEETISAALVDADDETLAHEAARKKAPRFEKLEWQDYRKKLSEFLARRGFSYAIIARVVTAVWNETHRTDEHFYKEEDIV